MSESDQPLNIKTNISTKFRLCATLILASILAIILATTAMLQTAQLQKAYAADTNSTNTDSTNATNTNTDETVEISMTWTRPKPGDVRDILAHSFDENGVPNGGNDMFAYYCVFYFTHNVNIAPDGVDDPDDALAKHNWALISLRYADGTEVEDYYVSSMTTSKYRTTKETSPRLAADHKKQNDWIGIRLTELLKPLTQYQIIIEPGITSADGFVSTERYVIPFSTSDKVIDDNGTHSVVVDDIYVRWGAPILIIVFIVGGILQARHYIKSRKNLSDSSNSQKNML